MELNNPINNQHMVNGLNRVLGQVWRLQALCKQAATENADTSAETLLSKCCGLHLRHGELLSDSLRFLGGAPRRRDEEEAPQAFISARSWPRELLKEERALAAACQQQINALVGSAEAISALNSVLRDAQQLEEDLREI